MNPPVAAEDDASRVAALLERCPIGGLVLFNGRWPETARTLAALQAHSRFPLLMATDMERGVGQQVEGATLFPHAMAFGALEEDAENVVETFARTSAREARACGIHLAFGPVVDVNLHRANPIIATRAFGTEPERVAQLGRAYLRGCRAEGLLTTAKHFPGHGRTATDSHATLPAVDASRQELERTDLVPFRAVIDAGVDAIMTAHVAYSALDDSGNPATLSPAMLRTLLRDEMGFQGVAISDSLLMEGVKETHDGPADRATALVEAGVDVLLDPSDPAAIVDGLVQAVEDGRLAAERLDAAFERVWRLKEQFVQHVGPSAFEGGGQPGRAEQVGGAAHQRQAEQIAERAVTIVHAKPGLLPLSRAGERGDGLLVIRVTPRERLRGASEAPLGEAVHVAFPAAAYREIDARTGSRQFGQVHADAMTAERILVAIAVEPAAWHEFGLLPAQEAFVRDIVDRRPTIVAALGSPHVLEAFPQAEALVCTYSDVPVAQRALIRRLAGWAEMKQ